MSDRLRWILVLMLMGCGTAARPATARSASPSEFRRLELPGFSLDVPVGLSVGTGNITEYRTGDISMQGSDRLFEVQWSVLRFGDDLVDLMRAQMPALVAGRRYELREPRAMTAGTQRASVIEATVEDREIALATVECGKRVVFLQIIQTSGPELAAVRDHALASFDCHPPAPAERALDVRVIGVDDPALLRDWYQVPREDGLELTNGVVTMIFQRLTVKNALTGESRASLADLLKALPGLSWSSTRVEKRWTRDGERTFHYGSIESDGARVPGLLVTWQCGDQLTFGVAVPDLGVSNLDAIAAMIMKLRCARPDDPPLHLRQTPP